MTRPKGVSVTIQRDGGGGTDHWVKWGADGFMMDETRLEPAGVPALKPGESVTGRMVFVPDKKSSLKKKGATR